MTRRLLAVPALFALALTLLVLPLAAPALAEETIPSYDVAIDVRPDGSLHVREEIDYDFGSAQRHGIYRTIPVRYQVDDTYDRVIEISGLRVVSTTGAPSGAETSEEGGSLVIRVGDPDRTVSGRQTYVLDYDVRGAMNSFNDYEEVYWNAIGPEWEAPIARGTVRVTVPTAELNALCFAGPSGSAQPPGSVTQDGRTVTCVEWAMPAYTGLTVSVAVPPGAVDVPPPILQERFSVARAFAVTWWSAAAALAILLGSLGGVAYLLWSRGRDRRYRGQVPGLQPMPGQATDDEPRPLFTDASGPVEFAPPENLRPGLVGTLIDEQANPLDVTATIVDLAVRGYLNIEELPREGLLRSRDWVLRQRKPADADCLGYERTLLAKIFKGRSEVKVSELKRTFVSDLHKVQEQLYDETVSRRWFLRSPQKVRTVWLVVGLVGVVLAVGLTVLLARYTHLGLLGVAAVLGSVGLVVAARWMPARTPTGSAELARVLGFRRYLATAEAEQLRFEERADVFSRFLPYAIVFGETERWARAFASLGAAQGGAAPTLAWYSGPSGWDFGHFGDSMRSFSDTTVGAITTSAASGGSGFSGGSSGGGFGGGGGGSW